MGQIVGGAAKPKRCNLNKLSQLETPAAGEHILVSSNNSMNAAGQGNFDCYIVGDGQKAATNLKLNPIGNFTWYSLYGNSYIYDNSIYIDSLLIYKTGVAGVLKTIQQTFTINNRYFLVCDRNTGNVRVSAQNGVKGNEDILLVSTGTGFLNTGALSTDIAERKLQNINLELGEAGKAITNTGAMVSTSGYSYSAPVYIEAGTFVAVITGGYLLGALAKVDGNTYTPVIAYGNDSITAPRTGTATISESGYYIVSSNNFANVAKLFANKVADASLVKNKYSIKDALVGGAVWSATNQMGEVYQPCDGAQSKYFLSQKFLEINGQTDEITNIQGLNGLPYYILQYDEEFHYLGNSVSVSTGYSVRKDCRYIKLCVGDNTNKTYSKLDVTYTILSYSEPQFAYNGANAATETPNILFRTYELTEPFVTDNCSEEEATTSYRGINERIFNWGYIFLPKNYSRTGKPSPVIIHCHGTSGVVFNQQSLPYNTKYLQFLASCGYAVIGCSTFTSKYKTESDDGDFPSPLAQSCYFNLWKYMTEEFNLDKTGAYIFGYSAGGMNTILLTQFKQIPIKAAAVLAGSVDLISNMRILADYCNEHFFSLIGLPNTDLPTGLAADGTRMHVMDSSVKALILANKEKFIGMNPFAFDSTLDYWEFFDTYADIQNYTNTLKNNTALNTLVNNAKVFYPTPIKIWQAVDDANVPIQMSRWWRKMVMNGGGLCYMRELPAGCGAHYAVGYTGNESLTPMTDYVTPFGETINTPVAYAEMVDWFNRW